MDSTHVKDHVRRDMPLYLSKCRTIPVPKYLSAHRRGREDRRRKTRASRNPNRSPLCWEHQAHPLVFPQSAMTADINWPPLVLNLPRLLCRLDPLSAPPHQTARTAQVGGGRSPTAPKLVFTADPNLGAASLDDSVAQRVTTVRPSKAKR